MDICLQLLQSGRSWRTGSAKIPRQLKKPRDESSPQKNPKEPREQKKPSPKTIKPPPVEKVENVIKPPPVPEVRYKQIKKRPVVGTRFSKDKRRYWFYGDDRKPMDDTSQKVYRNILICVLKK